MDYPIMWDPGQVGPNILLYSSFLTHLGKKMIAVCFTHISIQFGILGRIRSGHDIEKRNYDFSISSLV